MTKAKLYNMEGNIVGEIELPASVFEVKPNPDLVHEAMIVAQGNRRVAIAHTKTRGEVRGGGKKPWKQKGTGRARHGSIRSPIWVGGGVTFGPRSVRNFTRKLNVKARRKALCMTLTDKVATGKLIVLDDFVLPEAKTKLLALALKKLPTGKRTMVVLPASTPMIVRASRNLPHVLTVTANALPFLEVLRHETLVMPKATLPVLEKLYGSR